MMFLQTFSHFFIENFTTCISWPGLLYFYNASSLLNILTHLTTLLAVGYL